MTTKKNEQHRSSADLAATLAIELAQGTVAFRRRGECAPLAMTTGLA